MASAHLSYFPVKQLLHRAGRSMPWGVRHAFRLVEAATNIAPAMLEHVCGPLRRVDREPGRAGQGRRRRQSKTKGKRKAA
jgi:hypothetical protein